jgi:CHASE3 domain sensor protein
MSIEKKKRALLAVALIAPFCLLVLLAVIALRSVTHAEAGTRAVLTTHNFLASLHATVSLVKDVETSQRGFLLTGRDDFLDSYLDAVALLPTSRQVLAEHVARTPDEAERFARLDAAISRKLRFVDDTITMRRVDPHAAVKMIESGEGKRAMDEIRSVLREMHAHETARLAARTDDSERRYNFEYYAALGILAVDLVMLGVVVLLLYKMKQLRQFVTVCAWTKEVKHEGRWVALEEFLKQRFNFDTSHSISDRGREALRGEGSQPVNAR